MHYDLKPSNILFTKDFKLKLVDFGISRELDCDREEVKYNLFQKGWGTAEYLSPETHLEGKISAKTDIWSYGVVLFEMIFKRVPFQNIRKNYKTLNSFGEALQFPDSSIQDIFKKNKQSLIIDLIENCLNKNPEQRFDIDKVLKHKVFQQLNSNK